MQVFASQEELGELCRFLDEDLESYAGFHEDLQGSSKDFRDP